MTLSRRNFIVGAAAVTAIGPTVVVAVPAPAALSRKKFLTPAFRAHWPRLYDHQAEALHLYLNAAESHFYGLKDGDLDGPVIVLKPIPVR